MTELVAAVLLAAGLVFNFLGCLGLVRLPDVYTRLQASTKCVTLGTCLILLAVIVATGVGSAAAKALIIGAFILLTCPTAAHALARGSYRSGIKPTPSVVDAYGDAIASECEPAGSGGNNEKA